MSLTKYFLNEEGTRRFDSSNCLWSSDASYFYLSGHSSVEGTPTLVLSFVSGQRTSPVLNLGQVLASRTPEGLCSALYGV